MPPLDDISRDSEIPSEAEVIDRLDSSGDSTSSPDRDPEARQFSIGRLLVLVTICAVVAGATAMLELPPLAQAIFTFWWMALTAYVVLRVPNLVLVTMGHSSRWRKLRADRAKLEAMIAEKRQQLEERGGNDPPSD